MNVLTLEEQINLVAQDEWSISNIENPYEEVCLLAVKKIGTLIQFIPTNKQTEKVCIEAIRQNVNSFKYILEENRTDKVYLEVVKKKGWMIQQVPVEKRTKEICLEAFNSDDLIAMKYVPVKYITEEMYLDKIKKNYGAIVFIPEERQTEKIILESIKVFGLNIKYIPKEKRTFKMCLYSFLYNYDVLGMYIESNYFLENIDKVAKYKESIKDIVFYDNDKCIAKKIYNEDEFEIVKIDLRSLKYLSEYLIDENTNNHFILEDTTDIKVLKKIALTNNELIIVNTGNLNSIHAKIANKII